MEIEVYVNLPDLKQAIRRLMTRLSDEAEAGSHFIVFSAQKNNLEIIAGETSEILSAVVVHGGRATVPYAFFAGIARTLRFHCGDRIALVLSAGMLRINRTEYRHPRITVLYHDGEQAISVAKPAKLQNL